MTLEIFIAGTLAAWLTYETILCVLFARHWRAERIEFLRERFGRDALSDRGNEVAAARHHLVVLVVVLVMATASWAWLIEALMQRQT